MTIRYKIRRSSGEVEEIAQGWDAKEMVAFGLAVEWWSEEPFGSRDIERNPESFVGKTVNLAGKGGGLWWRTTIVGYRDGKLILSGGAFVRNTFEDSPERHEVGQRHGSVYPFDIARGFVWGGPAFAEEERAR